MEQNTQELTNIQPYNDLYDLRIITFWNILKDKNIFLLDKNYFVAKNYTEADKKYLNDLFDKMYDDFFKLVNNQKSKTLIKTRLDEIVMALIVDGLKSNYNLLVTLANEYRDVLDFRTFQNFEQQAYGFIKQLDKKIAIKHFDGIETNLKIVKSYITAVEQKIKSNDNYVAKGIASEIKNIYDTVAIVESALGRSLTNIETMSVMQWLAYQKQYEEILKSKKNGKG